MAAKNVGNTSYTVNMPHQGAWAVYINGIEVPVSTVDVQFGVWAIPTATIRLIPHVILQRIGYEDRLQVEIYYLDSFFDPSNVQMCFLGEFEVVAWSYQNTSAGRFLQLDCRSHLKILEQLRFYYMSSLNDMMVGNSPQTYTDGNTMTSPSVMFPLSLFQQGLITDTDNPETFIKSPFEFVRNLLRGLTAPPDLAGDDATKAAATGTIPRTAMGVAGRNFFGRWIEMTDFRRKWAALPFFDDATWQESDGCFPLLKAVSSTEMLTTIKQQIGNSVGAAGTAWELLQRVYGSMYMELNAIPAPPAVQLESKQNQVLNRFQRRGGKTGDKTYGGLLSYMVKPQCIFGIPPISNVIFPSMIKSYSISENFESQPTRIYLGESYISSFLSSQNSGQSSMDSLAQELLVTGYPTVVQTRMQNYMNNPTQNTRNFLLYPEELYKGPVSKHTNAPPWLYMLEKQGQSVAGSVSSGTYVAGKGKALSAAVAIKKYGEIVKGAAKLFKIPEDFMFAIMGLESSYNDQIVSYTGAGGLMQFMPGTFYTYYDKAVELNPSLPKPRGIKQRTKVAQNAVDRKGNVILETSGPNKGKPKQRDKYIQEVYTQDLFDPEKNIYAGAAFLSEMAKKYGVTDFSIEAFNPGNEVPSPIQCILIGYNSGSDRAKTLFNQRKAYLAQKGKNPQTPSATGAVGSTFDEWAKTQTGPGLKESWMWTREASAGVVAHWRFYSRQGYNAYKAYLVAKAAGGGTPDAAPASAPQAPKEVFGVDTNTKPTTVNKSKVVDKGAAVVAAKPGDAVDTGAVDTAGTPSGSAANSVFAGSPTNTNTAGVVTTDASVFNVSESMQVLGNLFKQYAKYEYYRSRYETRSATVSMVFNPYILPGFPALVLDNSISSFHSVGYVQNISHGFNSSGDMSTTVTLSFVRTLPEYVRLMIDKSADLGISPESVDGAHEVGPAEPIREVSQVFQYADTAREFYRRLFYTDVRRMVDTIFSPEEMLYMRDLEGEEIQVGDNSSWVPEDGFVATPKEAYQDAFRSYDSAMSYVSRPVATMQQIIELKHGKTLEECLKSGEVSGPIDSFSSGNGQGRFYARISHLLQPGVSVDRDVIARITNVDATGGPVEGDAWEIISADHGIPESRRNWDAVLIKYRNIVRGSLAAV